MFQKLSEEHVRRGTVLRDEDGEEVRVIASWPSRNYGTVVIVRYADGGQDARPLYRYHRPEEIPAETSAERVLQ